MSPFRPEIQPLVDGRRLASVKPDIGLARARLAAAEEHLESGRDSRRSERNAAARSAFYEAIWYALMALLAGFGLELRAKGEEGQHAVLMAFGEAELRETPEEREAGGSLDAIRAQRNQQMYRVPGTTALGSLPKVAIDVVGAVDRRLSIAENP